MLQPDQRAWSGCTKHERSGSAMCQEASCHTLVVEPFHGSRGRASLPVWVTMGEVMNSIEFVVLMSIAALWAAILVLHARRLLRLTRVVAFAAPRERVLRHRLRRAWW